jgi:uncharacterized protein (TIGR03000 family)
MRCTCIRGSARACGWLLLAAATVFSQAAGGQGPQKRATLEVRLPAGARLMVDGTQTKQTGEIRKFFSPPLPAGQVFRYELEATWTGPDGKPVNVKKTVRVRAGEPMIVDLRTADNPPPDRPPVPPIDKPRTDKPPDRKPDVEWVPTPPEVVKAMLELAGVGKDDVVYDLGCGDGRIVIAAVKDFKAKKAVGFDIDPKQVDAARANVKKNDVGDLVSIERKDIFDLDLSKASVVTLYLLPTLNVKLIPQLNKMKPGSRVVSHAFDMEDLVKPKKKITVMDKEGNPHDLFLWEVPLQKK